MPNFKLVVFSKPTPGEEYEHNDWYNSHHLQDVVAAPGFQAAQRFRILDDMGFIHSRNYIAIYEMECESAADAVADLLARRGTPAMLISDAIDMSTATAGVFVACSSVVRASVGGS